jgi:hypothetical protein
MGTSRRPSGFLFAIFAAAAGAPGAPALAQHGPAAPLSPYSLALNVAPAPLAAAGPATALHCASEPGLTLSLVGRAQVSAFGVFGKVGTTSYSRPDTSAMGMAASPLGPEPGSALSWGGGVSYDITPRLSAAFEWASYDLRAANGVLRTTNLGLKYRY